MQQKSFVIGLFLGTIDHSAALRHSKHKKYDAFTVPKDIMDSDWTGTKYVTSHRCFGARCKEDDEAAVQLAQPLGQFEFSRDAEAGYPAHMSGKDSHDFAKDHIDERTGRFKTPFEVSEEKAAEAQKDLEETYEKPYFWVKEDLINDWPGTRFVTTHRCYGHPCKSDLKRDAGLLVEHDKTKGLTKRTGLNSLLQLKDDDYFQQIGGPFEVKEGSFKIGDLQSHRYYENGRAWNEGEWPHAESSKLEDINKFVMDRYVPEQGRIMSTEELDDKDEQNFRKLKMQNNNKPAFIDKEHVAEDWASHHSQEGKFCYGKHSCKFDDTSLLQLGESADPWDPNYKDVDDIMKRFADEDKEKALAQQDMAIGDDPRGGIDKIAIASLKHIKDEDTKFIKEVVEGYLTGGKGPNGLPNGDKILERAQAQLAAEEIIHTWVSAPGVSEEAMELFMKKNLGNVWNHYDMNNRGYLDNTEWTYFMRTLLESMGPADKEEKNPYAEAVEVVDKKKSKKEDKPKITKKEADIEIKKEDSEEAALENKTDKKTKKETEMEIKKEVSDEEPPKKQKVQENAEEGESTETAKKNKKTTTAKEETTEEKAETTTEEGAAASKKKKTTEKAPEAEDK